MRFLEGFINNKIEVLDGQLKESGESLNAINDFKLYLKTEVDSQNDKLVQSMQNVFSNYDQLNQSITALSLRMDQVTSSN